MKRSETWYLKIDEKKYPVTINYRKRRSMGLRFDQEKEVFVCNVPNYVSTDKIKEFIADGSRKLLKRIAKRTPKENPINGDDLYIFGEKVNVPGYSSFSEKEKEKYLKKTLLAFLEENVKENATRMNVKTPYSLKVRKMKTRWGVNNSKSVTLTFSLSLVHYSQEIIESVVIHELAHDFVRNHKKSFYDIVYKYSPNYKTLHVKLSKGEFK